MTTRVEAKTAQNADASAPPALVKSAEPAAASPPLSTAPSQGQRLNARHRGVYARRKERTLSIQHNDIEPAAEVEGSSSGQQHQHTPDPTPKEEHKAPETNLPDSKVPESKVLESKVPELKAPKLEEPNSKAPETHTGQPRPTGRSKHRRTRAGSSSAAASVQDEVASANNQVGEQADNDENRHEQGDGQDKGATGGDKGDGKVDIKVDGKGDDKKDSNANKDKTKTGDGVFRVVLDHEEATRLHHMIVGMNEHLQGIMHDRVLHEALSQKMPGLWAELGPVGCLIRELYLDRQERARYRLGRLGRSGRDRREGGLDIDGDGGVNGGSDDDDDDNEDKDDVLLRTELLQALEGPESETFWSSVQDADPPFASWVDDTDDDGETHRRGRTTRRSASHGASDFKSRIDRLNPRAIDPEMPRRTAVFRKTSLDNSVLEDDEEEDEKEKEGEGRDEDEEEDDEVEGKGIQRRQRDRRANRHIAPSASAGPLTTDASPTVLRQLTEERDSAIYLAEMCMNKHDAAVKQRDELEIENNELRQFLRLVEDGKILDGIWPGDAPDNNSDDVSDGVATPLGEQLDGVFDEVFDEVLDEELDGGVVEAGERGEAVADILDADEEEITSTPTEANHAADAVEAESQPQPQHQTPPLQPMQAPRQRLMAEATRLLRWSSAQQEQQQRQRQRGPQPPRPQRPEMAHMYRLTKRRPPLGPGFFLGLLSVLHSVYCLIRNQRTNLYAVGAWVAAAYLAAPLAAAQSASTRASAHVQQHCASWADACRALFAAVVQVIFTHGGRRVARWMPPWLLSLLSLMPPPPLSLELRPDASDDQQQQQQAPFLPHLPPSPPPSPPPPPTTPPDTPGQHTPSTMQPSTHQLVVPSPVQAVLWFPHEALAELLVGALVPLTLLVLWAAVKERNLWLDHTAGFPRSLLYFYQVHYTQGTDSCSALLPSLPSAASSLVSSSSASSPRSPYHVCACVPTFVDTHLITEKVAYLFAYHHDGIVDVLRLVRVWVRSVYA